MPILLMNAQDGTGSESNYSSQHIFYDGGPTGIDNPVKITPRDKTGIKAEILVPLFAATKDSDYSVFSMYAGSYQLLTFENDSKRIITPYGRVFTPHLDKEYLKKEVSLEDGFEFKPENFEVYIEYINNGYNPDPSFYYTCGSLRISGERFGDPHAVFVPELVGDNVIQAVGFIPFKEDSDNSPELMALMEQEAILPWRY